METLIISNYPDINLLQKTFLGADVASGQPTANLQSITDFTEPKVVLIGIPGNDSSEIKNQITAPSGQNVTFTSNFVLDHKKDEVVHILFGDRLTLYRALNVNDTVPADGSFSSVVSKDIDADAPETILEDPTGGSDYWYKVTIYNSLTGAETSLANSEPSRGGNYGHYVAIDDVKEEAGFANSDFLKDGVVAEKRDEAESEVKGVCASAGYALPLRDSKGALYTPAVIQRLARDLAAGFLLTKEYGSGAPDTKDVGLSKIKNSRDTLKLIAANTLLLLGPDDVSLTQQAQVEGQPDDDTDESGDTATPEEPKFTMNQKF